MLRIGDVEVDPVTCQLRHAGESRRIDGRAMAVLLRLADDPGEVVSKTMLLDAVWPDRHVTEGVVPVAIRRLRKALDDDARTPRFIETVPRLGYRLVATVRRAEVTATKETRAEETATEETTNKETGTETPTTAAPNGSSRPILRWLVAAVVGLAVVLGILASFWPTPSTERVTLVALRPIETADPDLALLARRIDAQLISVLARDPATLPLDTPSLDTPLLDTRPLDRTSLDAPAHERSVPSLPEGSDSGVPSHVVSGTLRRVDDRVELVLRLHEIDSGTILWSPILVDDATADWPARVRSVFTRGAIPLLRSSDS